MLDFIAKARKALGATVTSAVLAYVAANEDGAVTEKEWGVVAGALVVGVVTYVLRNRQQQSDAVTTRSGPAPY